MSKDGGPAFPAIVVAKDTDANPFFSASGGISKLEFFAAAALSHPYTQGDDTTKFSHKTANWAFELAEAMLAESERRSKE